VNHPQGASHCAHFPLESKSPPRVNPNVNVKDRVFDREVDSFNIGSPTPSG
jgi:hypothetical protein